MCLFYCVIMIYFVRISSTTVVVYKKKIGFSTLECCSWYWSCIVIKNDGYTENNIILGKLMLLLINNSFIRIK